MATPFEQFIQDELPKRAALETNTSVGYDGDPNLPAAPTALKNAPRGTYYLQGSGLLWFKSIAGTATWVLSAEAGAGGIDVTEEDFTLTLSLTGTDPTIPLRIVNQAQADAWGAFRTVAGAVATLPDTLNHFVTIQFPSGIWDIVVDYDYPAGFDWLIRFHTTVSAVYSQLRFVGDPAWAQIAGTLDMDVQSCSGGMVTLQAPHGLTPDTYETCYVYVSEGTGAGQFLPLSNYSGSQLGCVGSFSPVLDSSSVVQIVDPSTTLNFSGLDMLPSIRGGDYVVGNGKFYMSLERLKLAPSNKALGIYSGYWLLRNCRFMMPIWGYTCNVIVYGVTFDLRAGVTYGEGAFYGQGADFHVFSASIEPVPSLFHGDGTTNAMGQGNILGRTGSLSITGPNHFQNWGPSYIDSEGPGSRVYLHHGSNIYPTSDQLATTAVVLRQGASAVVRTAAGLGSSSTFKGATYDFSLDGMIKTRWGVLDATVENGIQDAVGTSIVISEDTPTGIPTPGATLQAFTITMSATGTDPTFPLKLFNQAQATAWGAFKTVRAAIKAIPTMAYDVTLQFPSGVWDLNTTDLESLREIHGYYNPNSRTGSSALPKLIFAGASSWAQAPGTPASMAVQSHSGTLVTMQVDPGLTEDAFQGYYLVVLSGAGAGQYKALRYHDGVGFTVAQTYSPVLNSTSVVQIATRPTVFNLTDQDEVSTGWGYTSFHYADDSYSYAVELRAVEFTSERTTAHRIYLTGGNYRITEGTRLLTCVTFSMSECVVYWGDVIMRNTSLDVQYSTFYGSGTLSYSADRYGIITFWCNLSPDVEIAINGSGVGSRSLVNFNAAVCFQGFTKAIVWIKDGSRMTVGEGILGVSFETDGQAEYFVVADDQVFLSLYGDVADWITSTARGTISDFRIDGADVTWEEVETAIDNTVVGYMGSTLRPAVFSL